jgi:hypothetical protein
MKPLIATIGDFNQSLLSHFSSSFLIAFLETKKRGNYG